MLPTSCSGRQYRLISEKNRNGRRRGAHRFFVVLAITDCCASRVERKPQCNGLASVLLSLCLIGILNVTRDGASFDAASVHYGPTVRSTDKIVEL